MLTSEVGRIDSEEEFLVPPRHGIALNILEVLVVARYSAGMSGQVPVVLVVEVPGLKFEEVPVEVACRKEEDTDEASHKENFVACYMVAYHEEGNAASLVGWRRDILPQHMMHIVPVVVDTEVVRRELVPAVGIGLEEVVPEVGIEVVRWELVLVVGIALEVAPMVGTEVVPMVAAFGVPKSVSLRL